MKAFATALLNLAAFVELADDDVIDPDHAVRALEQFAADLDEATTKEKEVLLTLLREEISKLPEERDSDDRAKMNFYVELLDMLAEP